MGIRNSTWKSCLSSGVKGCLPVILIRGVLEIWHAYFWSEGYRFSVHDQSGYFALYLVLTGLVGIICGLILGFLIWLLSLKIGYLRSFRSTHFFSVCLVSVLFFTILFWWHREMDPLGGALESNGIIASAIISLLALAVLALSLKLSPLIINERLFSLRNLAMMVVAVLLVSGLFVVRERNENSNASLTGQPGVFLLSIDTLRADHIGCYGNPTIHTPFMDYLSKQGLQFAQCYAQIPGTNPNFTTIMTSLYPHEHGVFFNGEPVNQRFLTLPEILGQNGYYTGAFIAASVLKSKVSGFKKGFHVYNEEYSIRDYGFHPRQILTMFNGFAVRTAERVNESLYPFLNFCSARKFFVWLHYYDPHNAYNPPSPFNHMYNTTYRGMVNGDSRNVNWFNENPEPDPKDAEHLIALYDGEVAYTDKCLEQLYRFVQKKFKSRVSEFLYVFTADHGENMCDHAYQFGHGPLLYNPSLKVPLIVAGNGITGNKLITGQVETIDIAPAVLHTMGVNVPGQMIGHTIFDSVQKPGKQNVFAENGDRLVSMETMDWKCILDLKNNRIELYSMIDDPAEKKDLAATQGEIAASMKDRIEDFLGPYKDFTPVRPVLPRKTLQQLQQLGYLIDTPTPGEHHHK